MGIYPHEVFRYHRGLSNVIFIQRDVRRIDAMALKWHHQGTFSIITLFKLLKNVSVCYKQTGINTWAEIFMLWLCEQNIISCSYTCDDNISSSES